LPALLLPRAAVLQPDGIEAVEALIALGRTSEASFVASA
jgi:hypothetical protein